MTKAEKQHVRKLLADYMYSEGCSCCQNIEGHSEAKKALAYLFEVKPFSDGSGYDFTRYRTRKGKIRFCASCDKDTEFIDGKCSGG